jgi:hypothetical protein
LSSSNSSRTTTSTTKMKMMRSTLPRVTMRLRRCTEMLTSGNPSVLKLWYPPIGFVLCWDTWASPPPLDTESRESRVQGGWHSKSLQRSSPGPGSSAGTRGQPSELLSVMLWITPPVRPSLIRAVEIRMSYRTPSTTFYLSEIRASSMTLG